MKLNVEAVINEQRYRYIFREEKTDLKLTFGHRNVKFITLNRRNRYKNSRLHLMSEKVSRYNKIDMKHREYDSDLNMIRTYILLRKNS